MSDRDLRRADRVLAAPALLAAVCERAVCCHVGFVAGDEPYVVPLNFGWEPGPDGGPARFWFHSAPAGRKAALIAARPRVCVQLQCDLALVTHPDRACAWTQAYRSLLAWGRARPAAAAEEARRGLEAIMRRHSGRDGWTYPEAMLARTLVWCVDVQRVTGKAHALKDLGPEGSAPIDGSGDGPA